MIEKETRIKEDCPPRVNKSWTKILAGIAAVSTLLLILQNLVIPMVHQATTQENAAIAAKVEVNGNRITALEAIVPDIKERLARIENKIDQAKIALDETKALASAPPLVKKGG